MAAAAEVLDVTPSAPSALLNERADLSPKMAIRIEKTLGVSMETLMRMENCFEIAEARKHAEGINLGPYAGKPDGSRSTSA